MRRFILFVLCAASSFAQTQQAQIEKFNHVQWTLKFDRASAAPGATVLGRLEAHVDPGWHMYSLTTPPGPIPTTIKLTDHSAVAQTDLFEPPPIRRFDPNFNADTETYEGAQTFLARIQLRKDLPPGPLTLTFEPRYQTCSNTQCIPPRIRQVGAMLDIVASAPTAAVAIPAGYIEAKPGAGVTTRAAAVPGSPDSGSLGGFLMLAFGFGLAAIFTPCVFPMIPITMSYFMGRGGLAQATTFCLGLIVLSSGIGLISTLLLGPGGIVAVGSNAWVNAFTALVFVVLGLSFLGAFELTLPSSVLTKLNSASGKGGFIGTLIMGLTFALTSFACVGPFMGTLLAGSIGGSMLRPVLGMVVFSSGLSLPFFLLALFPQWLKKLPRSGEWLGRVKIVMGFLVLAAALKYIYTLDAVLQTGIVTRERFLAAWFVLFGMAGVYLLGFLRLPGIEKDAEIGPWRMILGIAFLGFAISIVPGMYGGRLGELEAYIPPPGANSIGGGPGGSADLAWIENDLQTAFTRAKAEGKMVVVNFTGYACTNCHWMKANMFTRPEIAGVMKNMVLVDLYADGPDAASAANLKLEEDQFKTIAEPFYVLYDADRNVVATYAPKDIRDQQAYLAFLNTRNAGAPLNAAEKPSLDGAPFRTLDGAALSTVGWKGKVVVLNYWATWCVPCRKEIPEFNRMQDELSAKGVEVVGISMDEDGAQVVKPFLEQNPMKYTVGLGTGSMDQLPITVVLDRNGNTVQRFDGLATPDEIRAAIAKAQAAG